MGTNTRSENVNTYYTHPDYLRWLPTWLKLNDLVDGGADTVKKKGRCYLPATTGQLAQWTTPIPGAVVEDLGGGRTVTAGNCPTLGAYSYDLYKFRAIFYEYPSSALSDMVGRLINESATVELPAKLVPMIDTATKNKQSFERLVEEIYREQGKYSRCGIMADFDTVESVQTPYVCIYDALRILNWNTKKGDDGEEVLDWVILDDSQYIPTGVTWDYKNMIRVLALDPTTGDYFTQSFDVSSIETREDFDALAVLVPGAEAKYPEFGNKRSKEIPFVFINVTNISPTPELPIMNNLANTSLAIYRGEADYRQALFMQGQATPAFRGVSNDERKSFLLGAQGAVFSNNENFDAFFMEVSGAGLSEMRESQDKLHKIANEEGMKLVESGSNESGEALKQRGSEQTVSLNTMASTCEAGLERMVEIIMTWGGITGEVKIELNREFIELTGVPMDLKVLVESYNMGAPITLKDIHKWARAGGLSETDWEEMQNEMQLEGRDPLSRAEENAEIDDENDTTDNKAKTPEEES